jgi:hypothetical protein
VSSPITGFSSNNRGRSPQQSRFNISRLDI